MGTGLHRGLPWGPIFSPSLFAEGSGLPSKGGARSGAGRVWEEM